MTDKHPGAKQHTRSTIDLINDLPRACEVYILDKRILPPRLEIQIIRPGQEDDHIILQTDWDQFAPKELQFREVSYGMTLQRSGQKLAKV